MTVTDVIRISGNRYQIMIDGEFAFVLYKGELSSYKIEKEKSISKENYEEAARLRDRIKHLSGHDEK